LGQPDPPRSHRHTPLDQERIEDHEQVAIESAQAHSQALQIMHSID
jgi:hypothetical protein